MSDRIVLIGPAASGKSTLGEFLGAALGVPFTDVDEVGEKYYAEVGWDIPRLIERIERVGRVAAEREWEPARAHAVQRVLEDYPFGVLALGAGHTNYHDPKNFEIIRAALADVERVVWIEPSPDVSESIKILRARSIATKDTDWIRDGHDFLEEWLLDAKAKSLATHVLHTDGKSLEQCVRDLVTISG